MMEHNENVQHWKQAGRRNKRTTWLKIQHPSKRIVEVKVIFLIFYIEDEFYLLKNLNWAKCFPVFNFTDKFQCFLLHHISDQISCWGALLPEETERIWIYYRLFCKYITNKRKQQSIPKASHWPAYKGNIVGLLLGHLKGKNDSNALFQGRFVFNRKIIWFTNNAEKIQVKWRIFYIKEFTAKFDFLVLLWELEKIGF
jgi:hypothetical protein